MCKGKSKDQVKQNSSCDISEQDITPVNQVKDREEDEHDPSGGGDDPPLAAVTLGLLRSRGFRRSERLHHGDCREADLVDATVDGGVKDDDEEGDPDAEEEPDVDHLEVGGLGERGGHLFGDVG